MSWNEADRIRLKIITAFQMETKDKAILARNARVFIAYHTGSWDVCRMCALEVFISDSTRNVHKKSYSEYELWIYCISCGRKEMEESKPEVAPYSAEQIEEIAKAVLTLTEGL